MTPLRSICIRRIMLSLLVLAGAGFASSGHGDTRRIGTASRPWPLPISISLSSSFGEYRDGHIHAGMDIRTHGREGIACKAVGDGAITRMRASSGGYGKALYLKLMTGETVVYAHLSEFSPAFERYLYDAQVEQGAYTVDLFIPATRFPVREGDIIAYSGSTGTRAPHLHFEVRDIRENPVNPLSRGWKLIDDRRPEPKRILWVPVTASSRVDGATMPREVGLVRTAPGSYCASDTVTIVGAVGVGVHAIDRSDENSGKLAPSKIELSVNGVLRARIERERFSYAQTSEVELEYEMERVRTRGEHFLLLFERSGETLGGRLFVNGGFICSDSLIASDAAASSSGCAIHSAHIEMYDKNGNSAQVTIPFRTAVGVDRNDRACKRSGHALFGFNDFLSIGDRFMAGGSGGLPSSAAMEADTFLSPGMLSRGVVTFDAVAGEPVTLFATGRGGIPSAYCLPVRQGEARRFPLPGLGVSLRSRGSSLFANAFMLISGEVTESLKPPGDQGLLPLSEPVFLGPWSLPVRSRIDIDFALAEQASGSMGVYRWNSASKRWTIAPSRAEGDTVSASVRRPGIYRVCQDTVAPVVAPPVLSKHTMYATGISYPEIIFTMTDAGSGADPAATELYLDERRVFGRWNPYSKKMFILLREENIIGDHGVTVVARDLAGNETRVHATLNFPAALHPDAMNGSN